MKRAPILLAVLAAGILVAAVPAWAQSPVTMGAQFRYWDFTDGNDMRDYLAYYAARSWHFQFEYWDFDTGDDQVRPEIGLHLRDRRNSVYNVMYRHEGKHERFAFGTDQLVGGGWVVRGEVSPLVFDDHTELVLSAGADYYFGSWNSASLTIIRDPRDGEFWTFPIRVRLANEANDWVQAVYAPATKKTNGWAFDLKYKWFRAGIERNSRYDFTDVDNLIGTVGVEFVIPPIPR